jgi:hypothetical protein
MWLRVQKKCTIPYQEFRPERTDIYLSQVDSCSTRQLITMLIITCTYWFAWYELFDRARGPARYGDRDDRRVVPAGRCAAKLVTTPVNN